MGTIARTLLLTTVALALLSCQQQTAFQRTAGTAAGVLSAAAQTLQYLHEGRLSQAYAKGAFVSFGEAMPPVSQVLDTQGAPGGEERSRLAKLLGQAEPAVKQPCLGACDWKRLVDAMNQAADELRKASQ